MSLIVVSNRVALSENGEPPQGGLAVALFEALKQHGGSWVGWSGEISDQPVNGVKTVTRDGISYGLIDLRAYGRDALAGLYRAARVCLVTPMRDSMNLVAKEFVAAQDPGDPGVLVLSRFAGAAQQLKEALIVNPYDRAGMAAAIEMALQMPLPERQRRWQRMRETISSEDIHWWLSTFHAMLAGRHDE